MKIYVYVNERKIAKRFSEGIKEYEKRLSKYCKISWQTFKNEEMLSRKIRSRSHCIVISKNGPSLRSEEFARKINDFAISGTSELTFVVGGNVADVDETIELTPMEIDIGLETLLLFEQLYRAYRIIHNEPYHK